MTEIMMATTLADDVPRFARASIEFLGPDDFDSASIRSAAPSYTFSSLLGPDPSPSSSSTPNRRYGLPPVPTGPPRHQQDIPSLSQFRIPSSSRSSAAHANPTARIYQNVALRRASASASASSNASAASLDGLMRRVMLERIEEEERNNRVRPLEDPYLVGEEAAARARSERMAREGMGGPQMKDREERERSWKRFRRDLDKRSNSRLPFRIGTRF
ncbi:hypothetical protein NEMBOFW57_001773 [Staphylotrichum longicolle]|uniref:Uncharacterized protein n=1 Tax=Staphylotrichum longicolle TaxID=669026 RepID=A0AAD4I434_9PEZI|nr:hypothetical protein NEMBOFW57_001773 [Staphylotrichum longicolle]